MPNNRKIKKNRGNKDYSLFALMRRAGGKITRARVLKKSRRKRATRAAIDSLAEHLNLTVSMSKRTKRILYSSAYPQGRYIGGTDPVNENE